MKSIDGLPDPRADVAGLQAFVAVARSGTVGRAAGRLGRTQPSISARLTALEQAWKTRLFRRSSRGMELTPEGALLLPRAEAILIEMEALDRTAGLPVARREALRLGAGDALGRERLPRALAGLMAAHPELEVHLREGPGPMLIQALREGEIDVALVVGTPEANPSAAMEVQPLIESEIRLLAPTGQLRPGRTVGLEALRGRRLVSLQPGSGFRRHLETAFTAAGIPFHPAIEVGNLSLVRRFVSAGLGVALVPAVAFSRRSKIAGVELRALRGVSPVRYHSAVRAGVPRPPIVDRLLRRMRA